MHLPKPATIGLLAVVSFFFSACYSPEYLSEEKLLEYVSNNKEFSKTITSGDHKIIASFRPTDLFVAQELRGSTKPSETEILQARDKYKSHLYFIVSLADANGEIMNTSVFGKPDGDNLLSTLSFRMSEYVSLKTSSGNIIPVATYAHQRTFGKGNSTDLLFAFENTQVKNSDQLELTIQEFGLGIGQFIFKFKAEQLDNAPKIFSTNAKE